MFYFASIFKYMLFPNVQSDDKPTAIMSEHPLSKQEISKTVRGVFPAELDRVDHIADALRHLPVIYQPMGVAYDGLGEGQVGR